MKDEILDDFEEPPISNDTLKKKLAFIVLRTFFILLVVAIFDNATNIKPLIIFGLEFNLMGLLIVLIIIDVAIKMTTLYFQFLPPLSHINILI